MKRVSLEDAARPLLIWGFSFLIIASLLIVYVRMPVGPLLGAGVVTLSITLFRIFR